MRKVKVRLDELMDAFDNCRIGFEYWLDLQTGELILVGEEIMTTDEIEKIMEQIEEEPERYLPIPEREHHESYQEMVEFAETVKDELLKEKLFIALDGRGAFRRFKNVPYNYPEERERWFSFKEQILRRRVQEWLEENDLELEEEGKDAKF